MADSNQYILGHIRTYVWSGFYSAQDVYQMIEDILDESADEEMLRAAVVPEFRKKRQSEMGWPVSTDCDRLDDAFADLNDQGIIALHNTGMTMSDGLDDVRQAIDERGRAGVRGYCFYHGQDLQRAVAGSGLWLAFGDVDADPVEKTDVGNQIRATLARYGLNVDWSGDPEKRLFIPKLDWKRRRSLSS